MRLTCTSTRFAPEGTALIGPLQMETHVTGITCVLGYNGAGKSLFLELCHGMQTPTSGTLTWDGINAVGTRQNRGYIFQHRILLRRSVRNNIALPMQAAGWSKADIDTRLEELLDMAKLIAKADDPAAILSGGEAQRMSLVRALSTRPKLLIMDEPTSSLDPRATKKFENLIQSVASAGVKFMWATHNISQARQFADDVIFVNDGQIAEHGPAKTFFKNPTSDAARDYIKGT